MSGDFHQLLIDTARRHGFPIAGALDIELAPLALHVAQYDRWISKGFAGAMSYLERGRDRRADPRLVFPEAKSVLCVGKPYDSRPAGAMDPTQGPRYSRYLRSADYHSEIASGLETVMREVATSAGDASLKLSSLRWKVCVDTSAVLERSWAMLAGLGWIGKNTMLIHPRLGSYFFIGVVLLNRETGHGPTPLRDYCGNCTRCLDACPTKAFTEPHLLDATRCIAYLTLEKRGELPLDKEGKRAIGTWIAGCDICQEVCPFNTKAAKAPIDMPERAISLREWKALLQESPEAYRERVKDSALSRVKPAQFSRNLALTLANAISIAGPQAFLELRPLVRHRLEVEQDETARLEWQNANVSLHREVSDPYTAKSR